MNGRAYPFVGVDLTAGKRPSDLAALDEGGRAVAFRCFLADDELVDAVIGLGARIVAIDSPMGLPAGLCCLEEVCGCAARENATGRSAERALADRGISCFWTTKRTIIKAMIYRAIALKARLESTGFTVLEVYPYATKRILLGSRLPRKDRPEGLSYLMSGARRILPGCRWPKVWQPTHDALDALYCAITARLFALGETESLGNADEVPLIVPRAAAPSRAR
jgi:predicted nuclease with RNAse H fold